MRLSDASVLSFIGGLLVLACGSGSAPSLTPGYENGTGGSMSGPGLSTTGTGATADASAVTPSGGAPAGVGGGAAEGAQPSNPVANGGGSTPSNPAAGGSTPVGTSTGGKVSSGNTSGDAGSGGTATGGRPSGGSGGIATGGRPSGGSSGGGTSAGGSTDPNCTDNPNPEQPDISCSTWKEWGNCDQSWMIDNHICDLTCGRCTPGSSGTSGSGNSGGSTSTGGGSNNDTTTTTTNISNVSNGQQGFATRYWDCCKPTCGWQEHASRPVSSCDGNNQSLGGNYSAQSACSGGNAHMCWGWAPWSVASNLSYGFVAFNGASCGTCFQLDFSGNSHNANNDAGSQSLAGKHMIVQVINTGGIQQGQFDILVPGGGVGDFNACSSQWGTSDLGEQYGGFFLACQKQNNFDYESSRSCARNWCQKVFGSGKQDLLDGCMWYVEWAGMADNPGLTYGQVSCPGEISAVSGM